MLLENEPREQPENKKRDNMKNFKNILNTLLENEYVEAGSVFNGFSDPMPRTAHSDHGLFRDDASQFNRINAFVHNFLSGTYLDPRAAIALLRSKLNHAGLDFEFNNTVKLVPGNNTFQLNRFGEKFGTTPTHDLLKQGFDRGIEYLPLRLSFVLSQMPDGKMMFTDIMLTRTGGVEDQLNQAFPNQPVEEKYDEAGEVLLESSNMSLSIMNMVMKNREVKTKVLEPVFRSLLTMKAKKKLSQEEAMNRLNFAAKSATRRLIRSGKIKKDHVSDTLVSKIASNMYKKFKGMRTLNGE
jgi:hypothetical protein